MWNNIFSFRWLVLLVLLVQVLWIMWSRKWNEEAESCLWQSDDTAWISGPVSGSSNSDQEMWHGLCRWVRPDVENIWDDCQHKIFGFQSHSWVKTQSCLNPFQRSADEDFSEWFMLTDPSVISFMRTLFHLASVLPGEDERRWCVIIITMRLSFALYCWPGVNSVDWCE